jgi:drug/metabolite transporter (DMT)-like permease
MSSAMPIVFVGIWSTGFIVARYGMPNSPPFAFLWLRFAFSILCFLLWIYLAKVPWPSDKKQWLHLSDWRFIASSSNLVRPSKVAWVLVYPL